MLWRHVDAVMVLRLSCGLSFLRITARPVTAVPGPALIYNAMNLTCASLESIFGEVSTPKYKDGVTGTLG